MINLISHFKFIRDFIFHIIKHHPIAFFLAIVVGIFFLYELISYIRTHSLSLTPFILSLGPFAMERLYRWYSCYCHNQLLLSDPNNLSKYKNGLEPLFIRIKWDSYRIFKKCHFDLNVFFWYAANDYRDYFYTDNCEEQETVEKINKRLQFFSQNKELLDKYFEFMLVSYACNEDKALTTHYTNSFIPLRHNVHLILQPQQQNKNKENNSNKTPDLYFKIMDEKSKVLKTIIIDVYNGHQLSSIERKCRKYHNQADEVYVFASHYIHYSQFLLNERINDAINDSKKEENNNNNNNNNNNDDEKISKKKKKRQERKNQQEEGMKTFSFYRLSNEGIETINDVIITTDLTLSALEVYTNYRQEFSVFISEYHYWMKCILHKKIFKTRSQVVPISQS